MTSDVDIELEATGLQPGERTRIVCPTCGGGTKRAKTMSVARDESGSVSWYCFRAVCDAKGGRKLVRTSGVRAAKPKINPYRGPMEICPPCVVDLLNRKIGWGEWHRSVGRPLYAYEDRRVAFPIISPMGTRRGYVMRGYEGWHVPKALNRMSLPEPHLSWYGTGDKVIIVEDIPSAVRAAKYMRSVALCGTHAPIEYINEIARHSQQVVWALDKDALANAVEQRRQTALLFRTSQVLPLERDLKDLPEKELARLLKDI